MLIDRISFVANWRKGLNKMDKDGETTALNNALAPLMMSMRRTFAKYPYRYQFSFDDGLIIQVATDTKKVPTLRFEFNPQTTDYKRVLSRFDNSLVDIKITRLDYAQDYDLNFSRVLFGTKTPVKSCVFRSRSQALETLYLGAPDASIRYRIYDKALESGIPMITKWRIEAQVRFTSDVEPYTSLRPFKNLIINEPDYDYLSVKERALVIYLLENPDGFKELAPATRSKYKKLIKGKVNTFKVMHPNTIYHKEKKQLLNYIHSILDLTSTRILHHTAF